MPGHYEKADPNLDKNVVHISQVPEFKPYKYYPHDEQPDHSNDWGNNSLNRPNWLYGTFCQGHFIVSFDGLQLADCQCIPMCLSSIIYSNLYPNYSHRHWSKADIYRILNQGNRLYAQHLDCATPAQRKKLQREDYFLAQSSILEENYIYGRKFIVERKELLYGYILGGKKKNGGLINDLVELFNQSSKYGILIAKKSCRAIWAADGKYFIFDPHAISPHKTAVLIENDTIEDLFQDLKSLLNCEDDQLVKMPYDLIPIGINGPSFNGLPENDDIALCSMDKPKELETNYNASKDETHETDDVQSSQAENGHDEDQTSQLFTVPDFPTEHEMQNSQHELIENEEPIVPLPIPEQVPNATSEEASKTKVSFVRMETRSSKRNQLLATISNGSVATAVDKAKSTEIEKSVSNTRRRGKKAPKSSTEILLNTSATEVTSMKRKTRSQSAAVQKDSLSKRTAQMSNDQPTVAPKTKTVQSKSNLPGKSKTQSSGKSVKSLANTICAESAKVDTSSNIRKLRSCAKKLLKPHSTTSPQLNGKKGKNGKIKAKSKSKQNLQTAHSSLSTGPSENPSRITTRNSNLQKSTSADKLKPASKMTRVTKKLKS